MIFELVILGNSSATPTINRFPSSQYLYMLNHHMLIDCGEGTQMQMQRYKVKKSKIKHIFISHIHADHMLGLPGLLFSMNLMKRTDPLHIYGPASLFEILDVFEKNTDTVFCFEIIRHVTQDQSKELIFEDASLKVYSFPLYHRIPTTGFIFEEQPRLLKLNITACRKNNIPFSFYTDIKLGKDYISEDGTVVIKNHELTLPVSSPIKYAYCSDTCYDERIITQVHDVDLLYHESTFLHDRLERALETKHTTALQAGLVAKQAQAKKLILGHFSSRYDSLTELLDEAKINFPETYIANEGERFYLE